MVSNQPAADHASGGSVTFYAKNLADPARRAGDGRRSRIRWSAATSIHERRLYIGGRDHDPRSLWDGVVSRVTVTRGTVAEDDLLVTKPQGGGGCLFDAQAESIKSTSEPLFIWEKAATKPAGHSVELDALTDFCHVLINSNEFLYLH